MKTIMLAVGISQYASDEIPDLTVCHADAAAMVAALRELAAGNFAELVLLNDQATKAKIQDGVAWLAQNAGPGDQAVFYYSGHGASFPDDNGDEQDGQEEFLCPYDCGVSAGIGTFIRDDEIKQWLAAVSAKTDRVLCIFDSCHSGSGLSAPGTGTLVKELRPEVVAKLMGVPWPPPTPKSSGGDQPPAAAPTAAANVPNQILLAGCQDYEQSFILPGAANSLFTTALIETLARPEVTTVQEWFAAALETVDEQGSLAGITQSPNIVDGSSGTWALR
jgi:uncharacterized caspase-like protein